MIVAAFNNIYITGFGYFLRRGRVGGGAFWLVASMRAKSGGLQSDVPWRVGPRRAPTVDQTQ